MNANPYANDFAAQLALVSKDFVFEAGHSKRFSNDHIDVWARDLVDEDGRQENLVTVFAGFPPPRVVRGLQWLIRDAVTNRIVKCGSTDAKGQFWLKALSPGSYRLELQSPLAEAALGRIEPAFVRRGAPSFSPPLALAAAAKDDLASQEFRSEDGTCLAILSETARAWVIDAEIRGPAAESHFAEYCLRDANHNVLSHGYIGLYEAGKDRQIFAGRIRIEREQRPEVEGAQPSEYSEELYLNIWLRDGASLSAAHRSELMESLARNVFPASQRVLEELLQALPPNELDA